MIKTLSIPQDLEDFLKDNPDLSPSKMLQSKIIEIMESKRMNEMEFVRLRNANEVLANTIRELNLELYKCKKKLKM